MSELITAAIGSTADIPLAVGFAVFSVLLVLPLMVALDIVQAIVDPRIGKGWRKKVESLGLFLSRGLNVVGLVIACSFVAVAIAAPSLAPREDPDVASDFRQVGRTIDHVPHPPSEIARLGNFSRPGGRVLHRRPRGTRSALRFGLLAAFGSATIGTLIGLVSGYLGGWPNKLVMGIVDAFLAFPAIAGLWLVQRVFFSASQGGAFTGLVNFLSAMRAEPLLVTLILFSWMPYARND